MEKNETIKTQNINFPFKFSNFINKFTSGKDTDDIIDDVVSDDTDNE